MFDKLRNKIIVITMTITTTVLILAGSIIMLFSSTMRPEPLPRIEPRAAASPDYKPSDQELREYIKNDRAEGNARLLATLITVGAAIEILVFFITYYSSKKIVTPVKDAYDNQKIFIANASHELKTPLAIIQANMEALDVARNQQIWKNNIETEISHANNLVLSLLQLAKMDAGDVDKSQPENINLSAELKNRIEIFQPKFTGKISLRAKKSSKYLLPRQDILQILDILLDNATKYGHKKISVVLEQDNIKITNDGATVSKSDAAKIFDRFYQADKTKEGSGLGLAIAKAICQKNGWHISCQSTNRLTTFMVAF